jgi:hypothetical protein
MDPEAYGYTGGSTAALRSKWFEKDADDYEDSECDSDRKRQQIP